MPKLHQFGGAGPKKLNLRRPGVSKNCRGILGTLAPPGSFWLMKFGMGRLCRPCGGGNLPSYPPAGKAGPVVVMMPPGLASKWPKEWDQISRLCAAAIPRLWNAIRTARAETPTDFFRLLDDSRSRRAQLIWMPTSCFSAGLYDGWIKLAFIRLPCQHENGCGDEAEAVQMGHHHL